jgi:hypothetical protein
VRGQNYFHPATARFTRAQVSQPGLVLPTI